MDRVICTCSHLGVNKNEKGIIIKYSEGGFAPIIKWDNGITEKIEFDFVDFIE